MDITSPCRCLWDSDSMPVQLWVPPAWRVTTQPTQLFSLPFRLVNKWIPGETGGRQTVVTQALFVPVFRCNGSPPPTGSNPDGIKMRTAATCKYAFNFTLTHTNSCKVFKWLESGNMRACHSQQRSLGRGSRVCCCSPAYLIRVAHEPFFYLVRSGIFYWFVLYCIFKEFITYYIQCANILLQTREKLFPATDR